MKQKLMRSRPPEGTLHALYYRHVERVQRELREAAAAPAWWRRFWKSVRTDFDFWSNPTAPEVPKASGPQEAICYHVNARETTIGAATRRPRKRDAVVAGIVAMECLDCGMLWTTIR